MYRLTSMKPSRYFQIKQPKPSCFSWRLLLSLGPIIGLICFGFWLVHQEQRYAQQEAQEDLEQAASRVMKRLEYHLRHTEFDPEWKPNNGSFPTRTPETLILPLDAEGNCLLPEWPIDQVLPTPEPLPWDLLTETQTLRWLFFNYQMGNPIQSV